MKAEPDERRMSIVGKEHEPDRIVRRSEAARLLGRSTKSIDRLTARGVLRKVTFPRCQRAAGFRMSDIAKLIAGGAEQQDGDIRDGMDGQ